MGRLAALVGHLKTKVLDVVAPLHRLWLPKRGQRNKMAAAVPWIVGPLFCTEGGRGNMSSIFLVSTQGVESFLDILKVHVFKR